MPTDLIDGGAVLERGWMLFKGLLSADECSVLKKPVQLPWQRSSPQIGSVNQCASFAQIPFDDAPKEVTSIGCFVHSFLATNCQAPIPFFNEVSWQRFQPIVGHVGPHRDQSFYRGVVVVITLIGQAEFSILKSREPVLVSDRWITGDGDLVVLRGAGSGSSPGSPIHQIGPPINERLTLSFRHNCLGPSVWPSIEVD